MKGTPQQLAADARAVPRADHGRRQLLAFYAAGAAFRDELPISSCPFDMQTEADLWKSWMRFYDIQAKAKRKTSPAMPHAEDRRSPRRQYVGPRKLVTSSAAYAEQMGGAVDLVEERA